MINSQIVSIRFQIEISLDAILPSTFQKISYTKKYDGRRYDIDLREA